VKVDNTSSPSLEDGREQQKSMTNIGRVGEAEEMARVVTFLVSDDCTFMHGADVFIDGGVMLQ